MKNKCKELKATPNYRRGTFTIRRYHKDGTAVKYRTFRLEDDEFASCLHHTEADWENWLKYSTDYYLVR